MSIYTKLNEARERFHALQLKKTGHNKFAGYNYFELGDFLIPALKVFRDVGLCAVVSFDKDMATMSIIDVDNPTHEFKLTSPMGSAALKGCHEVQNIGAVETYQRRYLWVAALEIVEHDAIDATTGKGSTAGGVITATDGAEKHVSDTRRIELDEMVAYMVECHEAGQDMPSIKMYTDLPTNEDKVYVWQQLKPYSKLRSSIKASSQKVST